VEVGHLLVGVCQCRVVEVIVVMQSGVVSVVQVNVRRCDAVAALFFNLIFFNYQ
jgi:hypothetical protein